MGVARLKDDMIGIVRLKDEPGRWYVHAVIGEYFYASKIKANGGINEQERLFHRDEVKSQTK